MKASDLINPLETQLDRIEAKLDQLLAAKKPKPRKALTDMGGDFSEFWKAYPLKKGRQAARRAWTNRKLGDVDDLILDVKNRIENDRQWIEGNFPHAATYLNGERWNDEITPVEIKADKPPADNNQLEEWAINKGFRNPRPGESFAEYRRHVNQLYKS